MGRWRSEAYQAVDKEKYQVQCYDLRDDLALLLGDPQTTGRQGRSDKDFHQSAGPEDEDLHQGEGLQVLNCRGFCWNRWSRSSLFQTLRLFSDYMIRRFRDTKALPA